MNASQPARILPLKNAAAQSVVRKHSPTWRGWSGQKRS